MSRFTATGRVLLYTLDMDMITDRAYRSIREREDIIYSWRRRYPTLSFYIVIQPNVNIYED
jgi:hypothetical protein